MNNKSIKDLRDELRVAKK